MNELQSAVRRCLCCWNFKYFPSHFQQSQGIQLLNPQRPLEIKLSSETSGNKVPEHPGGNRLGLKHSGCRYGKLSPLGEHYSVNIKCDILSLRTSPQLHLWYVLTLYKSLKNRRKKRSEKAIQFLPSAYTHGLHCAWMISGKSLFTLFWKTSSKSLLPKAV